MDNSKSAFSIAAAALIGGAVGNATHDTKAKIIVLDADQTSYVAVQDVTLEHIRLNDKTCNLVPPVKLERGKTYILDLEKCIVTEAQ